MIPAYRRPGLFLLSALVVMVSLERVSKAATDEGASGNVLTVDSGGSTPYRTLADAVKVVTPGDTIRVKPNTGPYRETLWIKTSGAPGKPIVVDGGDNIITGFDPITDWHEENGLVSCHIKTWPCVIAYKGERIVQDATTRQYTKYAVINQSNDTLTLRPGTSKEGWEISIRDVVVRVHNASYQVYRHIRATGGTDDGFNLHGRGTDLVFEDIEAFQNLDEGFSTHDAIISTVRRAKFWRNDNGIANSFNAKKDVVSSTFEDIDVYDNLGFGITLHDCAGALKNVRIWHNGMRQLRFNNAVVSCNNVTVYTPKWKSRQLVSYTDSVDTVKVLAYAGPGASQINPRPDVETADAPNVASTRAAGVP